jgi:hypothetical protein
VRTSILASGSLFLIAWTVLAKCPAPPSGRSSLVTEVITTYFNPISFAACATLTGSSGSGGSGIEDATEQNPQFLVHFEPRIIKVAVGFA